ITPPKFLASSRPRRPGADPPHEICDFAGTPGVGAEASVDFCARSVGHLRDALPRVLGVSLAPAADAANMRRTSGVVILGVLGAASLFASSRLGARISAYATGILAAILSFFLFVLAVVASPFDLLSVTPPDGLGLNPVLRDGGMLIHPPVVLAGFASF